MRAFENIAKYRDEVKHCDYRLTELLKNVKRKKKLNGEPRPVRSIESIELSLKDIRERLSDLETPAVPDPAQLPMARQRELKRLLDSALYYQRAKSQKLMELTKLIQEKKAKQAERRKLLKPAPKEVSPEIKELAQFIVEEITRIATANKTVDALAPKIKELADELKAQVNGGLVEDLEAEADEEPESGEEETVPEAPALAPKITELAKAFAEEAGREMPAEDAPEQASAR